MNKLLSLCACGCIALFGFSSSAFSNIITLTDKTTFTATGTNAPEDFVAKGWGDVNFLEGKNSTRYDFVTWKHQFTFNPPADNILSADLTLYFYDIKQKDKNQTEHAKISFENGKWTPLFEGKLPGSWIEESEVDISQLSDGIFQVSIRNQAVNNSFYIDKSILSIKYESVPEPSILSLFGISLLGLGFIRRKKN